MTRTEKAANKLVTFCDIIIFLSLFNFLTEYHIEDLEFTKIMNAFPYDANANSQQQFNQVQTQFVIFNFRNFFSRLLY